MGMRSLAMSIVVCFALAANAAQQLANTGTESWGTRQKTTSGGKVLWFDSAAVRLYNGSTNVEVQANGALQAIESFVFALGSGSSGNVIGAWRRGTDHAWLFVEGSSPVELVPPNPFGNANALNPEAVAIADGCVFFGWQAVSSNAFLAQHVFRVDPNTYNVTLLTGNGEVKGRSSQISTSQCRAVWLFNNTNNDVNAVYDLHYYNGSSLATIDSDATLSAPVIANGIVTYTKVVAGVQQVFVYDTNAVSPSPVQVTSYTSASQSLSGVRTDGRFVAWGLQLTGDPARHLVTMGGAKLTDATTQGLVDPGGNFPFQLNRGQFLWVDASNALRYAEGSSALATIPLSPATSQSRPYLADGYVAWLGNAGGVFRHTGVTPTAAPPPAAINATAGIGSAEVAWSSILGASSHTLYLAKSPGVTKENYASLPGGRRIANVTSPSIVTGLEGGQTYFFVVTATENGVEGPVSRETSVLVPNAAWGRAFGIGDLTVYDVEPDRANASILYAAVADKKGVWRSVDGGSTWTPLGGIVNGRDVRAVAANGAIVIAVTKDGDILRSTDTGTLWTVVVDGVDIGEQQKAVLFDPLNANTVYAADIRIGPYTENFIVKSIDGGATWTQLPDSAAGEIRAYGLVADTVTANTLYMSGTGAPVAKSTDGGTTWASVHPSFGFFYALALAPSQPTTVFTAGVDFSQTSFGVYKSTNGAANWTQKNNGFPATPPRINALLVDPANASSVHAGTTTGYYRTTDGADTWSAGPGSMSINALALTSSRRLVAATTAGIHLLALGATPALSGLTPSSGPIAGGTEVVISGSGFVAASGLRVTFDGVDGVVNVAASSATSVTVTTPAHASGAVAVVVINPDGQSTGAGTFTYEACAYTLSPFAANFSSSAVTGATISVSAPAGCTWTASAPGGSFVTITSTANDTVTYNLAQNTTGLARSTTLTVAGTAFEVTQSAGAVIALSTDAGPSSVSLTWSAYGGATSYEVWRSTSGAFTFLTAVGGPSHVDNTVGPGNGYLYQIRASNGGGTLASSNIDFAVPFAWTDPSLSAGVLVKSAHVTELRQALNALRAALGRTPVTFTAGATVLRIHVIELRAELDAIRAAVSLAPGTYTDPTITAGVTPIRAQHILEVRAAVD